MQSWLTWSPSGCWGLSGTSLAALPGTPLGAASLLGATLPSSTAPWHSRAGLAASTVPGAVPERKSNVNMSSGCVCFREGALQRRRKSVLLIQKPHRRKLKVLGVSMEDMLKKQQLAHKRQQERKQEGKNCS